MEDLIVNSGILSSTCYKEFFVEHNFLDITCLKLLLSKLIGYAIIAGSVGVKIPQIMLILNSGSAKGVSMVMFLLEVIGYSINIAYNYAMGNPFSTWGEFTFLFLQSLILVYLIYKYKHGSGIQLYALLFALVGFFGVLLSGQIENSILLKLQAGSVAIFIMSKVPQIFTTFSSKDASKLSLTTSLLNFAGSLARVFTTLQEIDDAVILASALLGTILNGILTLQIIWYSKSDKTKPE